MVRAGDVAFDGNGELGEVGVADDATELAAHREAPLAVLGPERYAHVFERFLEEFFTADDARFIASLGLSLARIPVNHRHLEDDMAPFEIRPDGFRHLDRAIELCAAEGIYTRQSGQRADNDSEAKPQFAFVHKTQRPPQSLDEPSVGGG